MWHQITFLLTIAYLVSLLVTLYLKFRKQHSALKACNAFSNSALKWLIITGLIGTFISISGAVITDLFGGSFYEWFEMVDEEGYTSSFHPQFKIAFFITIFAIFIYRIRGNDLKDLTKGLW
jgi:RsiW-degrading membrane proteinase PrsW (M82 family)